MFTSHIDGLRFTDLTTPSGDVAAMYDAPTPQEARPPASASPRVVPAEAKVNKGKSRSRTRHEKNEAPETQHHRNHRHHHNHRRHVSRNKDVSGEVQNEAQQDTTIEKTAAVTACVTDENSGPSTSPPPPPPLVPRRVPHEPGNATASDNTSNGKVFSDPYGSSPRFSSQSNSRTALHPQQGCPEEACTDPTPENQEVSSAASPEALPPPSMTQRQVLFWVPLTRSHPTDAAAAVTVQNTNQPRIFNENGYAMPVIPMDETVTNNYYVRAAPVRQAPKRVLGNFTRIGCFVVTKDWWHTLIIAAFVVAATLIFCISVVPRGEVYSPVIVSVLAFLSLTCLFLCVTIDPGIVPPGPVTDPPPQPTQVVINGYVVECKVCPTCQIVRPPRSTHCQFCDVCVEEFDHHCGVLGACVARRTFRFFGGFFIITTVLAVYIFVRSAIRVASWARHRGSNWDLGAPILCMFATVVGGCFLIPLAGMYLYFGCINSTQKEQLRRSGAMSPNEPYNEGYCANIVKRYFGPLGKSKIRSSGEYV